MACRCIPGEENEKLFPKLKGQWQFAPLVYDGEHDDMSGPPPPEGQARPKLPNCPDLTTVAKVQLKKACKAKVGDPTTTGPGLPWVWEDDSLPNKGVKPPPVIGTIVGQIPESLKDFDEQCFLLEYAQPILARHAPSATDLAKPNKRAELEGQPVRSLSWLTQKGGATWNQNIDYISHITTGPLKDTALKSFFEMTPAEKAQLVPFIQISADLYNQSAERVESYVLDFPNHTQFDNESLSVLRATGERRLVGIKDIGITLDGIDATMAKVVKVRASFIFQDFRTIFKKQKDVEIGGTGTKVSLRRYYSDLFSYGARDLDNGFYRKLRFKIGWAGRDHTIESEPHGLAMKLGLRERSLVLDVGIERYDIDFASDGSVILNISYIGAMEESLNGPESNLLSVVKETMAKMERLRLSKVMSEARDITKMNSASLQRAQLEMIAVTIFQEKLLATVKQRGGSAGIFANIGPLTVEGGGTRPGAWVWLAETAGHTNMAFGQATGPGAALNAEILKGDIKKLLNTTRFKEQELNTIVEHIHGIYKALFVTESKLLGEGNMSWALGGDAGEEFTVIGITERDLETLLKGMGTGGKVGKGAGIWRGIGQQTSATINDTERNIRQADETAKALILRQMALVKFQGLRELATALLRDQNIYYAKLTKTQKFELSFNAHDQTKAKEVFAQIIGSAGSVLGKMPDRTKANAMDLSKATVTYDELMGGDFQFMPYVLLGDLLSTLLNMPASMDKPTQKVHELITESYSERFKVDLGYIYYTGPFTGNDIMRFPLYYLPISLKRLNNFFVRNIIGKELSFYSFKNFVIDLLSEFLRGAQQNCMVSPQALDKTIMPTLDFIFGYHDLLGRHQGLPSTRPVDEKVWFIYGTQNTMSEIPTQDPTQTGVKAFGSYSYNLNHKIFHFYLGGQDRGIVQSIKLLDTTPPHLKEAVYSQNRMKLNGELDMRSQGIYPPMVFKLEVETLGCSTFRLGQYVFLDARQYLTATVNRIFQITGYYRLFKVEHKISRDTFTTAITAILEESLDDLKTRKSSVRGTQTAGAVSPPGDAKTDIITVATGRDEKYDEALSAARGKLHALVGNGETTADTFSMPYVNALIKLARMNLGGLTPDGMRAIIENAPAKIKDALVPQHADLFAAGMSEAAILLGLQTAKISGATIGKINANLAYLAIRELGKIEGSPYVVEIIYHHLNDFLWTPPTYYYKLRPEQLPSSELEIEWSLEATLGALYDFVRKNNGNKELIRQARRDIGSYYQNDPFSQRYRFEHYLLGGSGTNDIVIAELFQALLVTLMSYVKQHGITAEEIKTT